MPGFVDWASVINESSVDASDVDLSDVDLSDVDLSDAKVSGCRVRLTPVLPSERSDAVCRFAVDRDPGACANGGRISCATTRCP
jgi:uncharacterized protein YjbI with pentapeptide repeats